MAKRKRYYYQERESNRRKMVLGFFLVLALGAVAWKFYSEGQARPQEVESSEVAEVIAPAGAGELVVSAEPEVITPDQIVAQVREAIQVANEPEAPVVITQPVAVEAEVAEVVVVEPVEARAGDEALGQGREAFAAGQYFTAGKYSSDAVLAGLTPADEAAARRLINQASDEWLFSLKYFENDPFSSRYTVESGDMLVNIGHKYGVPYQLLMTINKIRNAAHLRAGQALKVVQGPFQVKVYRSRYIMDVYLGEMLVRNYRVGLGKPGRQTPTGLWKVRAGKKQVNPAWTDVETGKHYYPDDPENPLGERWVSLEGLEGDALGRDGFGIHGTIQPEEIGMSTSRGCIRLRNEDVIELYDLLAEGVSHVEVLE